MPPQRPKAWTKTIDHFNAEGGWDSSAHNTSSWDAKHDDENMSEEESEGDVEHIPMFNTADADKLISDTIDAARRQNIPLPETPKPDHTAAVKLPATPVQPSSAAASAAAPPPSTSDDKFDQLIRDLEHMRQQASLQKEEQDRRYKE